MTLRKARPLRGQGEGGAKGGGGGRSAGKVIAAPGESRLRRGEGSIGRNWEISSRSEISGFRSAACQKIDSDLSQKSSRSVSTNFESPVD